MDFSRICRICLDQCMDNTKQTYDIFTHVCINKNMSYCEMLASCTKLKPCHDDGLPKLICKQCSKQLKKTYVFNLLCEESDSKLRHYIFDKPKHASEAVDNSVVKSEEDGEVKTEKINVSKDTTREFIISILEDENLKEEIKLEPNGDNDSAWEAEDDNNLQDVKLKYSEEFNEEVKPKKKRGRKKRVFIEGDPPTLPESKLPHQCDICGKFLSTKSNLKAHTICHTDLRPYKCGDCPASFRGHSALFQHRKVHTGETPYHCEYCPKQFRRRTGLVNHIRMHTGEKMFSCDICFKTFVQSAQLSIHMKRHKGDKPFLCQDCGKGFSIKSDLKVHQRIHNGEKPYSCHLCTKTFATSGNLSIHIRIHNKEIRYNCKECHRGFVTCSAFKVHLKRHKGQRDYHCECGKTFYTSSALKQHKVVHTGEKKYQCKICDRKFTQTSHLSRHFKRDHAKPNAPVPSSEHYKLVLTDGEYKNVFGTDDYNKIHNVQTVASNTGVKCEAS